MRPASSSPPPARCHPADKIIAALEHVEDSKLTGHVVDTGIKINVAKLEALAKALDMVEEAAKKLPTPSQVGTHHCLHGPTP
jgi:hypothetical protein